MIVLTVAASMIFYLKKKQPSYIYLTAALLVTGIFMLSHNMHERYIFPALLLLMIAYINTRDKRLLAIFTGFSATLSVTLMSELQYGHFSQWDALLITLSAINVILFGWLVKVCIDHFRGKTEMVKRKRKADAEGNMEAPSGSQYLDMVPPIEAPGDQKLHFKRKDVLLLGILVIIYSIFALINLGSTDVPQTYWRSESVDNTINVSFDTEHAVKEIRYYGGIGSGSLDIYAKQADGSLDFAGTLKQEQGNMYNWVVLPMDFNASDIVLKTSVSGMWLHEIVFLDDNGIVPVKSVSSSEQPTIPDSNIANLFDEQSLVALPSYMTGMYFDEVYHARTAFEHLKGISPYENSHPPLGKIFIMIGVWIFGMVPFGWRIVGTLFGIAMIPLMYCFGLRLFKKSKYALPDRVFVCV